MSDKKEEAKVKALNVEITHGKAHGKGEKKDKAHEVGEKLSFKDGKLPSYLVGKCRVLANGKA